MCNSKGMAYADYIHCPLCDAKAFYDASIDWGMQHVANDGYCPLSVVALCKECFKTHEIIVQPRKESK